MTTSKPKDIFEAAGRAERESHPISQKIATSKEEEKASSVSTMLSRCRQLHENIASSLEKIFESSGISHHQYQKYISDRSNFSMQDWSVVEETQNKTSAELQQLVNKAQSPQKTAPLENKEEKLHAIKPETKRRPLTKRDWLQMH